jgi:hypothetical protein
MFFLVSAHIQSQTNLTCGKGSNTDISELAFFAIRLRLYKQFLKKYGS